MVDVIFVQTKHKYFLSAKFGLYWRLFNTACMGCLRKIYKNPPLPYFDMYDNGGFRFMILPSAPLSGFQDNSTVGRDSNKRVVVGFKFNRLRLSAQKVNG